MSCRFVHFGGRPGLAAAGNNGSSPAHCASVRSSRLVTARVATRSPVSGSAWSLNHLPETSFFIDHATPQPHIDPTSRQALGPRCQVRAGSVPLLRAGRSAASGAVVSESASLVDRVTGQSREVDVLIACEVAGHRLLVGVECRGRTRRDDVGWVEEMRAKHDDLPIDRLILVSASGFTAARRRQGPALQHRGGHSRAAHLQRRPAGRAEPASGRVPRLGLPGCHLHGWEDA